MVLKPTEENLRTQNALLRSSIEQLKLKIGVPHLQLQSENDQLVMEEYHLQMKLSNAQGHYENELNKSRPPEPTPRLLLATSLFVILVGLLAIQILCVNNKIQFFYSLAPIYDRLISSVDTVTSSSSSPSSSFISTAFTFFSASAAISRRLCFLSR